MENNINYLIQQLHLPVNREVLRKKIVIHFQYPSLAAVTEVLKDAGISFKAVKTDFTGLLSNGFPCLVHFKENKKEHLVVLNGLKNGYFEIYDQKKFKLSEMVLQKIWTGNTLYIFPPPHFSLKEKILGRKNEIITTGLFINSFILLYLILIPLIHQATNQYFFLFLSLVIVGLFISILLIKHESGVKGITKEICNFGKHFSCDAVLASPASKLFGFLSLANIGMIFFGSQMFCILYGTLCKQSVTYSNTLGGLSLFTIPYILFSLWYQKFKIRKWCPLCLSVLTVLVAQITVFLIFYNYDSSLFSFIPFISCLFIFILIGSLWLFLQDKTEHFLKLKKEEIELLRIKYHPQTFLSQLRAVNNKFISEHRGMVFGNVHTAHSLTIILNLFCKPCGTIFTKIVSHLKNHPEQIHLNLYILVVPEEEDFIAYFYQLYQEEGYEKAMEALNLWFQERNKKRLKALYPISQLSKEATVWCNYEMEWCQNMPIRYTPFLLFDSKIIPQTYPIHMVLQFLPHITEIRDRLS